MPTKVNLNEKTTKEFQQKPLRKEDQSVTVVNLKTVESKRRRRTQKIEEHRVRLGVRFVRILRVNNLLGRPVAKHIILPFDARTSGHRPEQITWPFRGRKGVVNNKSHDGFEPQPFPIGLGNPRFGVGLHISQIVREQDMWTLRVGGFIENLFKVFRKI
jgi:hypothetical protein